MFPTPASPLWSAYFWVVAKFRAGLLDSQVHTTKQQTGLWEVSTAGTEYSHFTKECAMAG